MRYSYLGKSTQVCWHRKAYEDGNGHVGDHRTLSAEVVLPPASTRLHTSCPLTSERVPNHEQEGSSHSELSGRPSTSLNGNKTLRSHMHRSANPMTAGKMSHHSRGYDSDLIGNDEWKALR